MTRYRIRRLFARSVAPVAAALSAASLLAISSAAQRPAQSASQAQAIEHFERKVRPLLANRCFECHSGKTAFGGLALDSRATLLKGGASGAAIIPGMPQQSRLAEAVRYTNPKLRMPPSGRLEAHEITAIERWIAEGAVFPTPPKDAPKAANWDEAMAQRKRWWSLRPVRAATTPKVANPGWSTNPVDRFILAKLEEKGLKPAPPANRSTLLRRASLVITGLPPTPGDLARFVADKSETAYAKAVDRLIASPQFGERWARHWLDVARFGETHGYEWNYELRDPWRYRDYLIRAFNRDVPFDRMILEQIAGDLLPNPRIDLAEKINESVIGPAFYRFGEAGHDDFKEIGYDVLDNQLDTITKAFQATTVSCARCHDHKLDAVSSKDYYALLGVLTSSRAVIRTIDAPGMDAAPRDAAASAKAEVRARLARLWLAETERFPAYLGAAQAARDRVAETPGATEDLDAGRLQKWTALLGEEVPMEHPLHVWNAAVKKLRAGDASLAGAWKELASAYEREAAERSAFNAKNFHDFGDFRGKRPSGWKTDGLGLANGPSASGELILASEGEQVAVAILPSGLYSHTLSERMNGSARSPLMPKDRKYVSLLTLGGRDAMVREIPDFRHLADKNRGLNAPRPSWQKFGKSGRDDYIYFEVVTKHDNHRYPERASEGKPDPRSFMGIVRAVTHDCEETPKDELGTPRLLFKDSDVASLPDLARRYAEVTRAALQAWAAETCTDDQAQWIDWLLRSEVLPNNRADFSELSVAHARFCEAEKAMPDPRTVVSMAEAGPGVDHAIFVRGDYRSVGPAAKRGYIEVLGNLGGRQAEGSGRLQLAQRIADPENPLTARVFVNRVWHHLFGAGLVRTTDDFGHMGELPSHPELLDYLARQFVADGWSVKKFIRRIVLSQAFRMSSEASPKAVAADPENRLLHRYPARRLEAEAIRDSILRVSGRLDPELYGPSINPYREKPSPDRKLYSGPLDGNGRRSIYIKVTLMEGPKFLNAFNFPDAKTTVGRRDVTNVPAQALTLLNDPFVSGQADFWAKRLVTEQDTSIESRIGRMLLAALNREGAPAEVGRLAGLARQLGRLEGVQPEGMLQSIPVWKHVAHTIFNMKEFIYIR